MTNDNGLLKPLYMLAQDWQFGVVCHCDCHAAHVIAYSLLQWLPLYTGVVDGVASGAVSSQQVIAEIQDSLQTLPSAEDDATILRVHSSCEEAMAKLVVVQERVAELEGQLAEAETKVRADSLIFLQIVVFSRFIIAFVQTYILCDKSCCYEILHSKFSKLAEVS